MFPYSFELSTAIFNQDDIEGIIVERHPHTLILKMVSIQFRSGVIRHYDPKSPDGLLILKKSGLDRLQVLTPAEREQFILDTIERSGAFILDGDESVDFGTAIENLKKQKKIIFNTFFVQANAEGSGEDERLLIVKSAYMDYRASIEAQRLRKQWFQNRTGCFELLPVTGAFAIGRGSNCEFILHGSGTRIDVRTKKDESC